MENSNIISKRYGDLVILDRNTDQDIQQLEAQLTDLKIRKVKIAGALEVLSEMLKETENNDPEGESSEEACTDDK